MKFKIFLIVIIFFLTTFVHANFLKDVMRKSPIRSSSKSSVYELQNTFRKIYDLYKNSVVYISTERIVRVRYKNPFVHPFFKDFFDEDEYKNRRNRVKKLRGLGTGFIISKTGHICTNYHVIKNISKVTVVINKKRYRAKIVGFDKLLDIALLKINRRKPFKPVYFGNSDKVRIGDMAVAIGNPFGFDKTYTFGIISATGRSVSITGNPMIQTDASINRGNSGGPLINLSGEVIGVNSMIYSKTGGNLGIGFALPINEAKQSLLQLKKFGKIRRGYIGVYMTRLSSYQARRYRVKGGAVITRLLRGGPAHKGGLRPGDIVVAFNNKPLKNSIDLKVKILRAKINKKVKLTVLRRGYRVNVWVKVLENKR